MRMLCLPRFVWFALWGNLLTMIPAQAAAPANDAFSNASDLGNAATLTAPGTTREATREADEPIYQYSEASVWFKWTAPAAGWKQIRVTSTKIPNDNSPAIAVFQGTSLTTLSAFGTDAPGGTSLRFDPPAGATYFFHVTELGRGGTFSLALADGTAPVAPMNDNFSSATVVTGALPRTISGTFSDASVESGEPNGYTGGQLSSVWYRWTPAVPTQVSIYVESASSTRFKMYTGSSPASLSEVRPRYLDATYPEAFYQVNGGTTYYIQITKTGTPKGDFTLNMETTAALTPSSNNNFLSRTSLGNAANVRRPGEDNSEATTETNEPLPNPNLTSTLWYSWTATANGTVEFKTEGDADIDTYLAIYTGTALSSLSLLAFDDDIDFDAANYDSSLVLPVIAGTTYQIQAGSAYAGWGVFTLSIAPADEDELPFRITKFTPSATTANLTSAPAVITCDITLSDLLEFPGDLLLRIEAPASVAPWGGIETGRFLKSDAVPVLVSGLTYRVTHTLPPGLPAGTYNIQADIGRRTSGYADDFPAYGSKDGVAFPGGNANLVITNTGVTTPLPVLSAFTITPSTVDVTNGDVTVQIVARATGLPTGNPIIPFLTNSLGVDAFFNTSSLTHDGTSWTGSITIRKGTAPGIYRPTLTLPGPALGRDYGVANQTASALPAGSTAALTIVNSNPDRLPPQLLDFKTNLDPVNLLAGNVAITGTCRITDASQLFEFDIGIDDGTETKLPGFIQKRISGTAQDGVYQWMLLIGTTNPSGAYGFSVAVDDGAGNNFDFNEYLASFPTGLPSKVSFINGNQDTAESRWMELQNFETITGDAAITASAINTDPDADGLPNLLEFQFGTNPALPDNNPGSTNLPVPGRNGDRLQLNFGKSTTNPALGPAGSSLIGEYSIDLNTWSTLPVTGTTPGFFRVESPPITAGKGYLRLRAAPRPVP